MNISINCDFFRCNDSVDVGIVTVDKHSRAQFCANYSEKKGV